MNEMNQDLKKENIFQKKQIIYHDNIGVCRVEEVTKLSAGKSEPILYYGLRSVYQKEKTAYVPVYEHKVLLRELITIERARELQQDERLKEFPQVVQDEVKYVLSQEGA